jgi:hypothetical protein
MKLQNIKDRGKHNSFQTMMVNFISMWLGYDAQIFDSHYSDVSVKVFLNEIHI